MSRPLVTLEHCLHGLCYIALGFAVVGVLGGSSCYVIACDDDYYYDDDDFDDDNYTDDDDDDYCYNDDDDDDDDIIVNPVNQGGSAAGLGGGVAVESMLEVGTRLLVPALRTRTRLAPRWSSRASLPRLMTFQSERRGAGPMHEFNPLLEFDTLTGLRGIGPFGPVVLGPVGAELHDTDFVEFGALFLSLNADVLGLPEGLGPWEPMGVEHAGTATHVLFRAVLADAGVLRTTLSFDGFGALMRVRHQIAE